MGKKNRRRETAKTRGPRGPSTAKDEGNLEANEAIEAIVVDNFEERSPRWPTTSFVEPAIWKMLVKHHFGGLSWPLHQEECLAGQEQLKRKKKLQSQLDALKALAEEFPRVDVGKVVQTEPSLLTESCDVLGRLKRLRRVVETRGGVPPPSMAIFYDGGPGCSNPTLFAKVFLEETRGDGEAYESDTAWG